MSYISSVMSAEHALDFLKEYIDPDTGDAKYATQLVWLIMKALSLQQTKFLTRRR